MAPSRRCSGAVPEASRSRHGIAPEPPWRHRSRTETAMGPPPSRTGAAPEPPRLRPGAAPAPPRRRPGAALASHRRRPGVAPAPPRRHAGAVPGAARRRAGAWVGAAPWVGAPPAGALPAPRSGPGPPSGRPHGSAPARPGHGPATPGRRAAGPRPAGKPGAWFRNPVGAMKNGTGKAGPPGTGFRVVFWTRQAGPKNRPETGFRGTGCVRARRRALRAALPEPSSQRRGRARHEARARPGESAPAAAT